MSTASPGSKASLRGLQSVILSGRRFPKRVKCCELHVAGRAARGREHGKDVADYTLWTSASDLKDLRYYFRTFDDSRIRMIDLKTVDLDAQGVKTISIGGGERFEDVSQAPR